MKEYDVSSGCDVDSDTKDVGTDDCKSGSIESPFNLEDLDTWRLLRISELNQWDYPIFELADLAHDTILSRVKHLFIRDI